MNNRPKIIELSEELTNMIAAGEVIERPSSIVKELIENSIDALASVIRVDLMNSGLDKISITDNGIYGYHLCPDMKEHGNSTHQ